MTATVRISRASVGGSFVSRLEAASGQKLLSCYQCGKCSAGCPMAAYMDILPNQIIRLAQMGQEETLLASEAIWTCVSCFTCNTRCPKDIRIAEVIEALRETMLRRHDRFDRLRINEVDPAARAELPPIALISAMRKLTS